MIPLSRVRNNTSIVSSLRGKRKKQKELLLLRGKRDGNLEFNSEYWKKAKDQLKIETHNKCAYCEADTSVVAHGDVEHFRPKKLYWWLAYCYDNYLYSCQICNQVYKSDIFPIHGTTLQEPAVNPQASDQDLEQLAGTFSPDPLDVNKDLTLATFQQQMDLEQASLINPYFTDPATLFAWEADDVLREVRLIPVDNTIDAMSAAQAADKYLGINREELRELRWKEYKLLLTYKDVLVSGQLDPGLFLKVKETINDMMADDAPFAGMIRYFVRDVWELDLD